MALLDRTHALLIPGDKLRKSIADVERLSPDARRLLGWMTAETREDLEQEIANLGKDAVKDGASDRPRLRIGYAKGSSQTEALLVYRNAGGSIGPTTAKYLPQVSMGDERYIQLSKKTQITWATVSANPLVWFDQAALLALGLEYGTKESTDAWKRHLVRLWAGACPDAPIKEAGTRTKGAKRKSPETSPVPSPAGRALTRLQTNNDNMITQGLAEDAGRGDEALGAEDLKLETRFKIKIRGDWWREYNSSPHIFEPLDEEKYDRIADSYVRDRQIEAPPKNVLEESSMVLTAFGGRKMNLTIDQMTPFTIWERNCIHGGKDIEYGVIPSMDRRREHYAKEDPRSEVLESTEAGGMDGAGSSIAEASLGDDKAGEESKKRPLVDWEWFNLGAPVVMENFKRKHYRKYNARPDASD